MDLKTLRKSRGTYKSKLTIFKQYLAIVLSCERLSNLQVRELSIRLQPIKNLYNDFDIIQSDIENLCELPDDQSKEFKEREDFEADYFSTVASAEELLSKNEPSSADGDSVSQVTGSGTAIAAGGPTLKLPTIHLPTFSGQYRDWLGFHDTYTSLIHNNTYIPNIHKFHYLRASLKESAALVIQSIEFSAENYNIAWQLLCDRFNNNRLLVNNHIQALFNIESINQESSKAIRNLIDSVNKNLRALKTLKLPTEHWDALIIYMTCNKLDSVTACKWEEERNKFKDLPTLSHLTDFLKGRADLLETMEDTHNKHTTRRHSDTTHARSRTFIASPVTSTLRFNCPLCKGSHTIYQCYRFKSFPIETRIQKAKDLKLCLNCLRKGHIDKYCKLGPCKICSKKHNSLLHIEEKNNAKNSTSSSPECVVLSASRNDTALNEQIQGNITLSSTHQSQVLLSTALVGVTDNEGKVHKVRALLDNGSTSSFITNKLHAQLKLTSQNTHISVQGLSNQHSLIKKRCDVTVSSLNNTKYKKKVNCFIVPQITQLLPTHKFNPTTLNIPQHIVLADPSFYIPSEVQMLLGADLFWDVLSNNHISLGKNKPTLNETKLGWLVTGSIHPYPKSQNMHSCNIHSCISKCNHNSHTNTVHCFTLNNSDIELQKKLDNYFECESFNEPCILTKDEVDCENMFTETTTRQSDGILW